MLHGGVIDGAGGGYRCCRGERGLRMLQVGGGGVRGGV